MALTVMALSFLIRDDLLYFCNKHLAISTKAKHCVNSAHRSNCVHVVSSFVEKIIWQTYHLLVEMKHKV